MLRVVLVSILRAKLRARTRQGLINCLQESLLSRPLPFVESSFGKDEVCVRLNLVHVHFLLFACVFFHCHCLFFDFGNENRTFPMALDFLILTVKLMYKQPHQLALLKGEWNGFFIMRFFLFVFSMQGFFKSLIAQLVNEVVMFLYSLESWSLVWRRSI